MKLQSLKFHNNENYMAISVPGNNLRQFLIGGEDHTVSDDESYYLIFGRDGSMFVQIYYSPNNQYGRCWWSDRISPAEFAKHRIEGINLDQVVVSFLNQILPTE